MAGARVVPAGRALTITGGHGHNIGIAREVDGADAVRTAVREEIRAGARAIKVVATGGVLTPGIGATFTSFTPEELGAAVDEAHSWGAAWRRTRSALRGSPRRCAPASTPSSTRCRPRPRSRARWRSAARSAARPCARSPASSITRRPCPTTRSRRRSRWSTTRSGATPEPCGPAFGTCARPMPARRSTGTATAPEELIAMVAWGMSPLAAMVAGTANGAKLLRIPDIGRIAVGVRRRSGALRRRSDRGHRSAPHARHRVERRGPGPALSAAVVRSVLSPTSRRRRPRAGRGCG